MQSRRGTRRYRRHLEAIHLLVLLLRANNTSCALALTTPTPSACSRGGSRILLSGDCRRHRNHKATPLSTGGRFCRWTNHDRCHLLFAKDSNVEDEDDVPVPNNKNDNDGNSKPNILQMINPFRAGKNLRSTVESAIDLATAITNEPASRLSPDRRSIYYNYYIDDQLGLSDDPKYDSSPASSWLSSADEDYRPEVLVVGAAGSLGRVLVKRLILENKVRVRVLVRDLYSTTLNRLGTGVTYCQGDLNDMESLEYALTDVDKIIFCAGGDREEGSDGKGEEADEEWDALNSLLDQRSKNAQVIDGVGLRNLLHAYQNIRYSDYGTSQAAKRVLFKFRKRPADFGLFGIDDGSIDGNTNNDIEDDEERGYSVAATLSQCNWKTNKFGHGVFHGKVIGRNGEAAIASARLRSRSDPEQGIDLRSGGFAGLICRVCSSGGVYEAFVRTEAYDRLGIEYVCEFKTSSKPPSNNGDENTSRNKWNTVRLEFSHFRPRMRQFQAEESEDAQRIKKALGESDIPSFTGRDIRQLGFRYRCENNPFSWSDESNSGWSTFYLALDYIKVYRGTPEPEFVYLSDARIPPVVTDAMVKHDLHRLDSPSSEASTSSYSILEVNEDKMDRIPAETYWKYMGEEMIKQSGLR